MKLKIKVMKWSAIIILLLPMVLLYKPQSPPTFPKTEKNSILNPVDPLKKKEDSIQMSINVNIDKVENEAALNTKLKEDNIKLSKLENTITNKLIEDLVKERKTITDHGKYLYFTGKDFKALAIEYKGSVYHVVKDSVCLDLRKPLIGKSKCKKYNYFLKITK